MAETAGGDGSRKHEAVMERKPSHAISQGEELGGGAGPSTEGHVHPPQRALLGAARLGARSLHTAISLGDGDAVQKILDSGIRLAVLDPPGALHLVAQYPEAHHLVAMLLEMGADPEMRNEEGDTPLHSFVRANMLQAAGVLLARGAFVNAVNHRQDTPMHEAARLHLDDLMVLLLAYGADEIQLNREGKRPRDYRPLPR